MDAKKFRVRLRQRWRKDIRPLLILALVLCSIRSSLADWNVVPTGSMKPTILEGDRVFVDKRAYDLKVPFTTWHLAEWGNPQRGDIVVFYSPKDGTRLVKRVIGLPGDLVESRDNHLVLNGEPVNYEAIGEKPLRDLAFTDRASHIFATEKLPGQAHAVAGHPSVRAKRDFRAERVAEGHYFMMGDNRDDSYDSRFFGTVERSQIVGRATAVGMSLDRENHWSPRWDRFFSKLE
jgi:signal peptidase I